MDIVLEGSMDGVETAEEIHDGFDIPVIFLSGHSDDQTLRRAKITQPYGYLVKPFEERELRTTIELALFRHRIEKLSQGMRRWHSAILRSISDSVVVTDETGHVRILNPAAERLTGWREEDAFGKSLQEVFYLLDERNRTVLDNPARHVLPACAPVDLGKQALLVARDGREIPIEGSIAPIQDDSDDFTGFVVTFREATEHRHGDDKLQPAAQAYSARN
jgi:PAS domain S-box-containing protein